MKRFMIGQYGAFDYNKYHRDFKKGFYGIEACLFAHENDTTSLLQESQDIGFQIGVHFPLRAGKSKLRDALLLSNDDVTRNQAYDIIQQELDYLSFLKPTYILFHYPKPVILDDRVDWSSWRFADDSDYAYESQYSFQEFKENSDSLFAWLSKKGQEYQFTPVLEFDGLNKYIYEEDYLVRLLEKYSNIKLCLDTARLYLQDRIDPHFDSLAIIKTYAKFAEVVHLSNIQINDDNHIIISRFPVLPTLSPQDGWAPIEEYLQIINQENSEVKIMFEHRSDLVTDDELWECYSWVNGLMN